MKKHNFTLFRDDIFDDLEKYNQNDLIAYIAISNLISYNKAELDINKVSNIMRCSRNDAEKAIKSLIEKGILKKEGKLYEFEASKEMKKAYEMAEQFNRGNNKNGQH